MSPLDGGDVPFMNSRSSDLFPLAKWPSIMEKSLLRLPVISCVSFSSCRGNNLK
jgi:hypothetical protein